MTAEELIERLKVVPPKTLVVRPAASLEPGYFRPVACEGPIDICPSAREWLKGLFTTTINRRRRHKAVIIR